MNQPPSAAEVERLLRLSADGPQILADVLDACVEHLRAVQAARAALSHLPTDEVRAAIARRHDLLEDEENP